MIQTLWVTNPSGDILQLNLGSSDTEYGLLIFNTDGLGPPKGTVNGTGGPNFDGIRVNSVRADARHITLTLVVTARGSAEEDAKQLIYTYFPIKKTVILRVLTERKYVYIPAIVESNEMSQFSRTENAVISLVCQFPYFTDMEENEVVILGDGSSGSFVFPFSNESLTEPLIFFGTITDIPVSNIIYPGEVETGILIFLNLFGHVSEVTITNANGNQVMDLDFSGAEAFFGSPVQAEDQVFIITKIGQKSIYFVREAVFYNMLNGVDLNSDWIKLRPGSNLISVVAETGTEHIETEIIYSALREGV